MVVKNQLLNFKDLVIYQNDEWFMFSLDSVLLSTFVTIRKQDHDVLDLCTGNAPVPMILSFRYPKLKIIGIELQSEIYDLGKRSILENHLEERIDIRNMDVKNLLKQYSHDSFDVITCNPPYFKHFEQNYINESKIKAVARHEIAISLEEIISISSQLLKTNGTFYLVHRTNRLMEILLFLQRYHLEPKKIRLVYPKKDTNSNIVLIAATKNGKVGVNFLPPLYVHREDNSYTEEVKKMFE